MLSLEKLIYWGYVVKTHDTKGALLIKIEQNLIDEIEETKPVFLEIEGKPVPFFARPDSVNWKDEHSVFFHFEDINNIDAADELTGKKVYILPEAVDVDSDSPHKMALEAYAVLDAAGENLGRIIKFHDVPKNPLIEIQKENQTFLIPLTDDWIVEINEETKEIIMDLPEGLLE